MDKDRPSTDSFFKDPSLLLDEETQARYAENWEKRKSWQIKLDGATAKNLPDGASEYAIFLNQATNAHLELGEYLIEYPHPDPFFSLMQEKVEAVLRPLGLYVKEGDAAAILDPVEEYTDLNHPLRLVQGFIAGRWFYQTDVNLLLSPEIGKELFGYFFLLKADTLPLTEIGNFLAFQMEHSFSGDARDFVLFLKALLRDAKHMIGKAENPFLRDDLRDTVLEWAETIPLDKSNIARKIERGNAPTPEPEPEKPQQYKKWKPIYGKLTDTQYRSLLDFFGQLDSPKQIIDEADLEVLKKAGLRLPPENWEAPIRLRIPKKKHLVYGFFNAVWELHTEALNTGKEPFALYLNRWFRNFRNTKIDSLQDSLKPFVSNSLHKRFMDFLRNENITT